MNIRRVSIVEVEYAAYQLAKQFMTWDEPIPDFGTRFPNILESCLGSPFQSFGGKVPHRGLAGKGAFLFYLMIKNHPFENGNKRIAVMTLLFFLQKNGKWIEVTNGLLYKVAKAVAESDPKRKDQSVVLIENFLKEFIVKFPNK